MTINDASARGADEITDGDVRHSAITSHAIGVAELATLLRVVGPNEPYNAYRQAVLDDNVLGLATANGRLWRFKTLRRLYLFRPDSVLFRALSDLWAVDPQAAPLLAGLCALATDTVFRATADWVLSLRLGEAATADDLREPVEKRFPGVYAESSLATISSKAYASWQQTGHFGPARRGRKLRTEITPAATALAYALLLGHLQGSSGRALFETMWARFLDQPASRLMELASAASQQQLLELRQAGGVIDVGFQELLRPIKTDQECRRS
jgi:hypothetical protein